MKDHYLACVAEEAGEVTQASCKLLRFGPSPHGTEALRREVHDLLAAYELFLGTELEVQRELIEAKKRKVSKYQGEHYEGL